MIGDREVRAGTLAPEPAVALANLLDTDIPAEALPLLWHTVYLLDAPRQSDLGPDGHPVNGFPHPPYPGMRRMFAGGRVRTHAPLRLGRETVRTTVVVDSVEKTGRSGKLVFVTVSHSYEQDGVVKLEAEDDIVYRPGAEQTGDARSVTVAAAPNDHERDEQLLAVDVNSRLLFRYSALTYNAHRIHYDRDWCAHEGYSGLVIHGPLQALLMAEALRRGGQTPLGKEFSYRLVSPLVGEQRIAVRRAGADQVVVTAANGGTTATATMR